ncbi:MAG TPA: hypothetical protein VFI35_09905, partial [Actinomycetota bacterium]|nr:hypothetical protein [Actinomycetota bacterium]
MRWDRVVMGATLIAIGALFLLDPNPNVLRKTSRRLAAMHPLTVEADVMKPLPVEGPFDSAALNYV